MALIATPANPLPPEAREETVRTSDGIALRGASWLATSGIGRGTICLLQGRAEFIEKYFETITDLRARGYAVAAFDWRGQGGSARLLKNPAKGHVSHIDRYEVDLVAVIDGVLRASCPPPYYALAHSTGGLVLLRFMARRKHPFARALLSAPLLGLGRAYEPVGVASLLTRLASGLGLSRLFIPTASGKPGESDPFTGNLLTGDERRYARNAAIITKAPTLGIGGPTIGWVNAVLQAIGDINAGGILETMKTPLVIISAGNDQIVSNQAIERATGRLPIARHFSLPGARHELLMEQDIFREQVLAAVESFFVSEG